MRAYYLRYNIIEGLFSFNKKEIELDRINFGLGRHFYLASLEKAQSLMLFPNPNNHQSHYSTIHLF